jgi:WD40 repeat protein
MSAPVDTTDETANPGTPEADSGGSILETIMFTDIEGSVALQQMLGTQRYATLITRHGELFFDALTSAHAGKIEKHTGDGFMARFEDPTRAVEVALRFLWSLRHEDWGLKRGLRVRIGIHQGEVLTLQHDRTLPEAIGAGVNIAARVMGMAEGSQVLMTKGVFDAARQSLKRISGIPGESQGSLRWEAHGSYLMKGVDGTIEIFEVGEKAHGSFQRPKSGGDVQRSVSAEAEATLGWRPAADMEVPKRTGWLLVKLLGEGGFGEVWLAENRSTREPRVFKFCFDPLRLRSFKRELLLFRLIRESLGLRRDIATLYEVQLENPPFFLESEYCPGGGLKQWLERRLQRGTVPLSQRIEIVARVARALAGAHSVGIIHKDVKPSNIFIDEDREGHIHPRLADFGIGVLTDSALIAEFGLSFTGELSAGPDASRTGTRLYSAPEYMVGRPASIQGDIYSLGVVLYQMVIADFNRPLGAGWQRDVPDPLLIDDISRCVDVDPQRRFASALEVAERLETLEQRRVAAEAEARAAQTAQEQQRELVAHRRRLRVALATAGIALLLLAAVGIAAVTLQRSRSAAIKYAGEIANERENAESRLYVSDMQTAIEDLVQRRGEAARELINQHRPVPGKPDRRGWEWFFADSVLNPNHLARQVSLQPLRTLAVSPDQQQVAVAGDDGQISIWSCDSLEKLRTLKLAAGAVRCLAWKSATQLVAGLATGEVVVWNAAADSETKRWRAHASTVMSMDWNTVNSILTTGGADGVTAWWSDDGEPLRQSPKQGPVIALDWRQDGSEVAVVLGEPARIFVSKRDGSSDEHEYALNVPESAVAWRPGEYEVAIAMQGYPLRFFNPYTCGSSYSLPATFSPGSTAFAWSNSGDGLAVGGLDGKILVIDPRRRMEARATPLYGHRGRVTALHWLKHPDGERLLSVGDDGTLRVWDDLRRSQELGPVAFDAFIADAAWSPVARKMGVLLAGDELRILDGDSWEAEWSKPLPAPSRLRTPFARSRIAWSPDGEWLAAACPGRFLTAWHLADGRRIVAEIDSAFEVQWASDSQRLLLRTPNGWSWTAVDESPAIVRAIPHTELAACVAAIDRDQVAVLAPGNGTMRFQTMSFDGSPAGRQVELPPLPGSVRAWALSADRTRLAIGDDAGAVMWINSRSGESWRPNMTHAGPVKSIGWHPDGSRLVTVGGDGLSRIFNVRQVAQNWAARHELQAEVVASGWSADGRTLAVASGPGKALQTYDASISLRREAQASERRPISGRDRLVQACVSTQQDPEAEFGWQALAKAVSATRGSAEKRETELILAAAKLGIDGRFAPAAGLEALNMEMAPLTIWDGVALPLVIRVAQACHLKRWNEVVELCAAVRSGDGSAAWLALAKAEALERLGRRDEAEVANFEAWQHLARDLQGGASPAGPSLKTTTQVNGTVDLSQWANTEPSEDWTFGENNNLADLAAPILQPEGFSFGFGNFIQLAGKGFRVSRSRMLPRIAGWIPFNRAVSDAWFLHAASYVEEDEDLLDTCIGNVFLLRQTGDRAIRIPLIYGRNVWDWWVPPGGHVNEAPVEAIAWKGRNPHANYHKKQLALYRSEWKAAPGETPVVAAAIVSNVRRPAPMLLGIELVR